MAQKLTDYIDRSFPIGKSAGGPVLKIDAIRQVVSLSQRLNIVVITIIHQRIAENEEAWNLGLRRHTAMAEAEHRCHHHQHRRPSPDSVGNHLM